MTVLSDFQLESLVPKGGIRTEVYQNVQTRSVGKQKLGSIELLRIVSTLLVLICHVFGNAVGGAFLFAAMSAALTVGSKDLPKLAKNRSQRLIIPWIVWSGMYGLPKLIHAFRHHEPFTQGFNWSMLLYGTAAHLWYLPFAFVGIVTSSFLVSKISSKLCWGIATVSAVVIAGLLLSQPLNIQLLPQWLLGIPAICLGVLFNLIRKSGNKNSEVLTITTILLGVCLVLSFVTRSNCLLPVCIGTGILALAWMVQIPLIPGVSYLAALGYGIYLLHPMVLWFIRTPGRSEYLVFAMALAISGGITAIIQCTPARRFV